MATEKQKRAEQIVRDLIGQDHLENFQMALTTMYLEYVQTDTEVHERQEITWRYMQLIKFLDDLKDLDRIDMFQ